MFNKFSICGGKGYWIKSSFVGFLKFIHGRLFQISITVIQKCINQRNDKNSLDNGVRGHFCMTITHTIT